MIKEESNCYLTDQVNRLFDEIQPDGKPYSLRAAAAGINDLAGRELVSAAYLCKLRRGQCRNPSFEVVDAIAHWFGVDASYFSRFPRSSSPSRFDFCERLAGWPAEKLVSDSDGLSPSDSQSKTLVLLLLRRAHLEMALGRTDREAGPGGSTPGARAEGLVC